MAAWKRELLSAFRKGDLQKIIDFIDITKKGTLAMAVMMGNLQIVQYLISSGVKLSNYADFPECYTPLMRAIIQRNEGMVKLLLQNGASVQEYDANNNWPIHFAAEQEGSEKIVELLLGKGDVAAQLQARTKHHLTPLSTAAEKDHTSICQLLIHHGADVNAVDDKKLSALMFAAEKGHVSTMKLLLKKGADFRAQNIYQMTALSMAATYGHIDAAKILVPLLSSEDLMMEDEEGNTAAFLAARNANLEFTVLILKQGNGQQYWRSSKSTILHLMTGSSGVILNQQICHLFKELIHQQDSNGFTPAQFALRMNKIDNFITLVKYQPNLLQTDGFNLMKLALQYAHPEVVDLIQKRQSILHTYNEWFLYLTSNAGKFQERMQILNKHIAMFRDRRQPMVKEAIANAIKNNHLDVLKKLMELIIDFDELASIWPLWTAIDVGNDNIALYLLQLDAICQKQLGPDGSSPLQLCLIRNNKKVLEAWDNKCPDVVRMLTQNPPKMAIFKENEQTEFKKMLNTNVWNASEYVSLCKKYPMFNEQCSHPFNIGHQAEKEVSFWRDVLPHLIDVSACIPTSQYRDRCCAGHLGDKKTIACEILSNLVRLLYRVEDELNKEDTLMSLLGPKFILIGSIIEGTRLGHPDELDMSTMFDNISPTLFDLLSSDAFGLKLSKEGVAFFTKIQETEAVKHLKLPGLFMEGQMFNVLAFQQLFLTALEQAIPQVELPKNVQLGTLNSTFDITQCDHCIKASQKEGTWMHCKNCFPLLAQTKRGVVLNLIWSRGDIKYKCSIDLVPMYPVSEEDVCKLFGSVFQTLVGKKPAGWRSGLSKYIHIDRPVHGELAALENEKEEKQPLLIAMKVLNYGPGSNYIQCPGQSTVLEHFASRRIREAYVFTKGLIKLLNLTVKSYYLKKLFLNDAIIELSQTARNNQHFLLSVLCQPEWGTLFTDCLNMKKMEEMADMKFDQDFRAHLK